MPPESPAPATAGGALYWLSSVVLLALGTLGAASVGIPLIVLGLVLLGLGRWRRTRPEVVWPAAAATVAFFAGYLLVAPLGCTSTFAPAAPAGNTRCFALIGPDLSGPGAYDPPLWPAVAVGLALAAVTAAIVRSVAARQMESEPRGGTAKQGSGE